MEDSEPPDNSKKTGAVETSVLEKNIDISRQNSDLERVIDEEGILLKPNRLRGELAVLNPAVCQDSEKGPWPFLYRSEKLDSIGRYSTIDFRWLESTKKLSKQGRTIIKPEYEFEARGCEDPRLKKIKDDYYITYIAFDGLNARIALAKTKDFENIEKLGLIGPNISALEAITRTKDKGYQEKWVKQYEDCERLKAFSLEKLGIKDKTVYLWDKDASIEYNYDNEKWILMHRLEPHIQIALTDRLEDLKDQDFWREYLTNIQNHVFMRNTEDWESEKIGLGGALLDIDGEKIGLWHGVNKKIEYSGSLFRTDNSYNLKSRMRTPLLQPRRDRDIFNYTDLGQEKTKSIIFPTGMIKHDDKMWFYSGSGDQRIVYRSSDFPWIKQELNHPHNIII